jgi:hypothetical protein
MTTQAGLEKKERDFLAQCVGDAYQMLGLLPGVDANGPALVWLAVRAIASRRLPACPCDDTVTTIQTADRRGTPGVHGNDDDADARRSPQRSR